MKFLVLLSAGFIATVSGGPLRDVGEVFVGIHRTAPPTNKGAPTCRDVVCQNGGQCVPDHELDSSVPSFLRLPRAKCECVNGWTGVNCEHASSIHINLAISPANFFEISHNFLLNISKELNTTIRIAKDENGQKIFAVVNESGRRERVTQEKAAQLNAQSVDVYLNIDIASASASDDAHFHDVQRLVDYMSTKAFKQSFGIDLLSARIVPSDDNASSTSSTKFLILIVIIGLLVLGLVGASLLVFKRQRHARALEVVENV